MSLNPFYKWVNDNNPSDELSYRKGWWDYIEFMYRIFSSFNIKEASVSETFILNTPPPCEKLLMPISKIKINSCFVYIKQDFGNIIGDEWFLNIERESATHINGIESLLKTKPNNNDPFLVYKNYEKDIKNFSISLNNEYEVYTLLKLISFYTK